MHKTNLIKSFNKNRINEVWLEGLGGVWVNCCTVVSPFSDEDPSEDTGACSECFVCVMAKVNKRTLS